jgi:hypothetical protein
MIDLNKLTVEQVGNLQRECQKHLETWFGFSKEGKERQTDEFKAATEWRLKGLMEPCCECGDPYPRADLHFHGEIYCQKCRGKT